jgi:hypothetical protein
VPPADSAKASYGWGRARIAASPGVGEPRVVTRFRRWFVWAVIAVLVFVLVATLIVDPAA